MGVKWPAVTQFTPSVSSGDEFRRSALGSSRVSPEEKLTTMSIAKIPFFAKTHLNIDIEEGAEYMIELIEVLYSLSFIKHDFIK